jgi:hypothetical protein
MIDSGGNLIEGSTKKDLVLASETGSLRRLLAASGLAFRIAEPRGEHIQSSVAGDTRGGRPRRCS